MVGAELSESETALRVFLAAGGLILLGILFLVLTIWWWRSTKPESPALGPLEVMSERKWFTAAESERRRLIEQHRPEGAAAAFVAPEPVDLSVLARTAPSSFDDLRDPYEAPAAEVLDPEAAELVSAASTADAAADGADTEAGPSSEESSGGLDVVASGHAGEGASNGAHLVDHHDVDGPDGEDVGGSPSNGDASEDVSEDATVAMSRDETAAMPSPGRPSFVPHAGA